MPRNRKKIKVKKYAKGEQCPWSRSHRHQSRYIPPYGLIGHAPNGRKCTSKRIKPGHPSYATIPLGGGKEKLKYIKWKKSDLLLWRGNICFQTIWPTDEIGVSAMNEIEQKNVREFELGVILGFGYFRWLGTIKKVKEKNTPYMSNAPDTRWHRHRSLDTSLHVSSS